MWSLSGPETPDCFLAAEELDFHGFPILRVLNVGFVCVISHANWKERGWTPKISLVQWAAKYTTLLGDQLFDPSCHQLQPILVLDEARDAW